MGRLPAELVDYIRGRTPIGVDQAALDAHGRAIIAVSGHIGSIEVFAGAYAQLGIPTFGLADDSAFPELFVGRARRAVDTGAAPRAARKRSTMPPAMRKAVSERMKKYWASRRKARGAAKNG